MALIANMGGNKGTVKVIQPAGASGSVVGTDLTVGKYYGVASFGIDNAPQPTFTGATDVVTTGGYQSSGSSSHGTVYFSTFKATASTVSATIQGNVMAQTGIYEFDNVEFE